MQTNTKSSQNYTIAYTLTKNKQNIWQSHVKKTKTKRMIKRTNKNAIIMNCPFAPAFFITIATLFWKRKKKKVILRSLYCFRIRSLQIVMSPIEQMKVKPKETEEHGDFKGKKEQACRSKKNITVKIQTWTKSSRFEAVSISKLNSSKIFSY